MTAESYRAYLGSPRWLTMRRLALEAAEGRCLLCNAAEGLDVHHRTYDRVGAERLSDLVVLCGDCHGRHHGTLEPVERAFAESERVAELERELAAEMAGAAYLATEVERAWRDGKAAGRREAVAS